MSGECECVALRYHSLLGLRGFSEISLSGRLILQVWNVRFSEPAKVTQQVGPFPSPLTPSKPLASLSWINA